MRDPNGAFYSTQDADSEGVEGKFYVWGLDEFRAVVGEDADILAAYFDVTGHGNWEETNILHVTSETPIRLCMPRSRQPKRNCTLLAKNA